MEILANIHPKLVIFIFSFLFGVTSLLILLPIILRGHVWVRWVPIGFSILGAFYGNHGGDRLLQAIASSGHSMCDQMTTLAKSRNDRFAGASVDSNIKISEIRADCEAALLVFAFDVRIDAAAFSPSDINNLQADVDTACRDENSEPLFEAGWSIQKQYLTADGYTLNFNPKCKAL